MRLQMQAQVLCGRRRISPFSGSSDRARRSPKALREDVDIGIAAMHHDLHAIRAAALVAISDQAHVLGIVGLRRSRSVMGLPPIVYAWSFRNMAKLRLELPADRWRSASGRAEALNQAIARADVSCLA